jgi:thiol-disulfide isomerase/thioredoxin
MTRRRIGARPKAALALRAAAAAVLTALPVLTGCSSGGGPAQTYRFTNSTKLDSVIAAADRKPAEPVTGQLLDGSGRFDLTRYRGDVVVLNFWASWCGPCRAEMPQLAALYRRLHPSGVQFVGVDTKDSRAGARAFIAQQHVPYPIVYDQEGQIQLRLGNIPGSLPFTVLIDPRGRVAAVYLSPLTAKDLLGPVRTLRAPHGGHVS